MPLTEIQTGGSAAVKAAEVVREVLSRLAGEPGALLPILHEVQDKLGYVPSGTVVLIAEALNLSRAEVHGVITYYHHFRSEQPGRHLIQVCRAEACQAMGADALFAHAEGRLGCASHGTSSDQRFSLEPVYCLGLCASPPALLIGERLHARITPERFDELIAVIEETA